ncbi:TetR/AcrR family transcriptional regulator [Gryllotalpicola protaetiae]|uniref:TetR/AcrR family transcriptional regulator n=1 Tax=Gryllotalpicola protaetiae TaxID=2419771 RepID=A0A387BQ00_9MICO|nr:TetR/AcrR family transcriptional regulator [Gryllotalpicola protaetiae]AYG03100.1 TetR/AcrR family transcriptional regulator [Gryllotalpicola protaetiae]
MPLTPKGRGTRQRIIEGAAAHLRGEAGLEVTLDEVRASTRTSKSQIFHYFPGGKDELFLEVARFEAGRILREQQPHLDELDSWESWNAWRDAVIARYREQGPRCAMTSLSRQTNITPGAAEVSRLLLASWQERLRTGIEKMQASGFIGPQLDAQRASSAMLAALQGGIVILQATGLTDHLEAAVDASLDQLRAAAAAPIAEEPHSGVSN